MDPVRTEVMKNRFAAIAEEASTIAYRTAHTTFVKLTQDYQVALATPGGDFFAYPYQSGVTNYIGLSLAATLEYVGLERLAPGDVIICNDPFASRGMCTHIPDIHLLKPVFHEGRVIAIAWAFIHASDVGGSVPGSIDPTSTEVFQEGLRIRPVRLYRGGELNTQLLDLFRDNSRIPDQIWGDLQAMIAALGSLERRMHELCERHGVEEVEGAIADVLEFAELKAREVIARIPDGTWSFGDYLEGVGEADEVIFVHCRMDKRGDTMRLDFSGCDPQVPAALNFVTGPGYHPFLALAVLNYIMTEEPAAPLNNGLIRAIECVAPRGSVVNAEFPAAMGNRWVTVIRLYDAVLGCLDQALGGGPVCAGAGQGGIVMASFRDEAAGRQRISVVQPLIGGSGGRRTGDGVDAVDMPFAFLRSNPVEAVELESPLVVRRFELEPDSMGAGYHRGGAAAVIDLEVRHQEIVFTVRGQDRFVLRPWGVNGGHPGELGTAVVDPDTARAREVGKIKVLTLPRHALLRLVTPSGGGYGDPLERAPQRVLADVESGLLSPARAERDYGVVLARGVVDGPATAARRETMRRERGPLAAFTFGPERDAIDRVWSPAMRAALAARARAAAPAVRQPLLRAVRAELAGAGEPVTREALEAAIARWTARLAGQRPVEEGVT